MSSLLKYIDRAVEIKAARPDANLSISDICLLLMALPHARALEIVGEDTDEKHYETALKSMPDEFTALELATAVARLRTGNDQPFVSMGHIKAAANFARRKGMITRKVDGRVRFRVPIDQLYKPFSRQG